MTAPHRSPLGILRANARPAPALPALLVLLGTLAFAEALPPWLGLLGLAASCGLAIAAGFCSLFPPAAWLLLAPTLPMLTGIGFGPWQAPVLVTGIGACLAMLALQTWRVRTGRFVPSFADEQPADQTTR